MCAGTELQRGRSSSTNKFINSYDVRTLLCESGQERFCPVSPKQAEESTMAINISTKVTGVPLSQIDPGHYYQITKDSQSGTDVLGGIAIRPTIEQLVVVFANAMERPFIVNIHDLLKYPWLGCEAVKLSTTPTIDIRL